MDQQTQDFLRSINADWWPCGSRVTCDPTPTDTDEDYLVQVPSPRVPDVMVGLNECGYSWEGSSEHYQFKIDDGFSSFRKGRVNLIVSANPFFVERHQVATHVCKRLNLMNKKDRIALFQAVLYGRVWPG